jgi:hypothetical protein
MRVALSWSKPLAGLLACIALSGCTVALYGNETAGAAGATGTTASHVALSSSGSNYAVRAAFGRVVPPTAPGGQVVASNGSAAAVLLLGIVIVNAVDALTGGAGMKSSAQRPIAHTCSCYGYRPDQDPPSPNE